MELNTATDTEIYVELQRRRELAKAAELKLREEHAHWVLANCDDILKQVLKHSKSNCDDDNTTNAWDAKCTRCVLVRAQQDKYFDSSLRLTIDIHLEVLPELK